MKYQDDYRRGGVPMLGAVRGQAVVGLQVILYAWATVVCSLLLVPVAHMGVVYTVAAAASGAWFIYETHRLYHLAIKGRDVSPMRVFQGSITYLTILFVAVAVDPLLPW
jgi:protoheme IX farnesyltransferase